MPFPLPLDPDFRLEVVASWVQDVKDRLKLGDTEGAIKSWKIANSILLSLPPGRGDFSLERELFDLRVKLE